MRGSVQGWKREAIGLRPRNVFMFPAGFRRFDLHVKLGTCPSLALLTAEAVVSGGRG